MQEHSTAPEAPRPEVARTLEKIYEALDAEYQYGALDALEAIAKALRANHGPEALGLVRLVEYSPWRVREVIGKLDALGQHRKGGEGS